MSFKILLAVSLVATAIAGPATAETNLKLVEVITSPERTKVLQGMVSEFEAENPGTTVEIISLPWGQAFEKFATMVSAGQTPDVVEMPDTWSALYANNGALESLEPYLKEWDGTAKLNERTIEMARSGTGTAYMLPYGFYLRAMFYNKKLFKEAGVEKPPVTLADFREAAEKVSALPGKYGFCLRGGSGGLNGWAVFGATAAGTDQFFDEDGNSIMSTDAWIKGAQFMIDLYKDGLAPKDSLNWGFNEIVAGFYSGTCAMLDQDPDALIGISERMDTEDFGVTTMPKGENGKAYPTIGYAGWSMFSDSEHKDASWKLIAKLQSRDANLAWSKRVGTLPIYKDALDDPHYATPQFAGWFEELSDPDVHPLTMPTHLEEFAFFKDSMSIRTSQEALLGRKSAEELGKEWGEYLGVAQKKWLAK